MADDARSEITRVTAEQHGRVVGAIEGRLLEPVDYPPPLPGPS